MEKITFVPEDGMEVSFFVVEQTTIAGKTYLLVTEQEEGDSDALILRDETPEGETEGVYVIVDDDTELDAVAGVFADILEDVDFTNEES